MTETHPPTLSPVQRRAAAALFEQSAVRHGPARPAAGGLVADLYAPVFPAQVDPGVVGGGVDAARRY